MYKVHGVIQKSSFHQLGDGKTVIFRTHFVRFIGQRVIFRTRDGVTHHGNLRSVTGDGVYVRPVGGGITRLTSDTDDNATHIDLLQNMPRSNDELTRLFDHFSSFQFWLSQLSGRGLGGGNLRRAIQCS